MAEVTSAIILYFTAPEQNYIAEDQTFWNDVNRCRTAPEQNHCSGVKFRNDVPDFSIAVDVAKSIAVHCNAQNGPEKFLAAKEQL